jgi:hypothetical protein
MDLEIRLIGNPWINAGIVGFYEFHQKYGKSNSNISIADNQNGFIISGDEDAIISHFNNLMVKFLPGHFYKPEAHFKQYVTFDGNKLQIQKGPLRFQYIELMFPSINEPKTGSKNLVDLKKLNKEQLKKYKTFVKDDSRNQKTKNKPNKILPLDTSLYGHPMLTVETKIKSINSGSKRCSLCGRISADLVTPSAKVSPLYYGQGNYTFNSNWGSKKKICSLCQYFGIFALYALLSNWSRDNNKIAVNCFIPSGQNFKSLVTFTRAFREAREIWEWGNFKTDISYTNRPFESLLALMKDLTKKLKDMTNKGKEIDFGLSLDEFELSEPEVFYFRMEKPARTQMPAVRNVVLFQSISYLIELFSRGEREGIDFRSLFYELLVKRRDGEIQTHLRNRICQSICYGKPILLDLEEIIEGADDSYNLIKFLKFYLKEVSPVSFNVERAESIGKSIGEGAFKDGERMKVIHEIRGANSYDQLLTALMKVYSRLSGKGIEFYYINDFLKDIEPGNWREVRAYLVINAINRFQCLKKQNTPKKEGTKNGKSKKTKK